MATKDFGKFYWGVKVPEGISDDGELYLMADEALVQPDGSLVFSHMRDDGIKLANFALAPGKWLLFWAASMIDGSPVAVDHWAGEVKQY